MLVHKDQARDALELQLHCCMDEAAVALPELEGEAPESDSLAQQWFRQEVVCAREALKQEKELRDVADERAAGFESEAIRREQNALTHRNTVNVYPSVRFVSMLAVSGWLVGNSGAAARSGLSATPGHPVARLRVACTYAPLWLVIVIAASTIIAAAAATEDIHVIASISTSITILTVCISISISIASMLPPKRESCTT